MKAFVPFLFCLLFLTTGCKKEDENTITDSLCQYLSEPVENIDEIITCRQCPIECQELIPGTRYDYFYPSFNPDKETEFAYLRFDNTEFTTTHELWIFDYCTGEHRLIHDYALASVDWSIKDWIIFSAPNHMIYKIKSSGDSLTQLTFTGTYNRQPVWNSTGTRFYFNTQTGSDTDLLIADEEGNVLDTIENGVRDWNDDNMSPFFVQFGSQRNEIGYYDIYSGERYLMHTFDETIEGYISSDFSPRGVKWLNNNTVFWSARRRTGTTDITSGETRVLLKGYSNREYSYLSVSPNKRDVLINRIDIANTDTEQQCLFDNKYRIYLYNLEEGSEHWIQIPE